MKHLLFLTIFCMQFFGGGIVCGQQQRDFRDLRKGAGYFVGNFSNKDQSDTTSSPIYRHQVIMGRLIKSLSNKKERFVHMAWFHPANVEKPLDQRIFHFYLADGGTIKVASYYVPADKLKEGSWRLDEKLLEKEDLKQDVCEMSLTQVGNKRFKLLPTKPYCKSSVIGGAYHTVKLVFDLTNSTLVMYNAFFNKEGVKVMDYPNGSIFKRK